MLDVSWDPVLIGISFVVAFIAFFIALDSEHAAITWDFSLILLSVMIAIGASGNDT